MKKTQFLKFMLSFIFILFFLSGAKNVFAASYIRPVD